MKSLITCASCFLGRWFWQALRHADHDVTAVLTGARMISTSMTMEVRRV
jgi:hypothetical protein